MPSKLLKLLKWLYDYQLKREAKHPQFVYRETIKTVLHMTEILFLLWSSSNRLWRYLKNFTLLVSRNQYFSAMEFVVVKWIFHCFYFRFTTYFLSILEDCWFLFQLLKRILQALKCVDETKSLFLVRKNAFENVVKSQFWSISVPFLSTSLRKLNCIRSQYCPFHLTKLLFCITLRSSLALKTTADLLQRKNPKIRI